MVRTTVLPRSVVLGSSESRAAMSFRLSSSPQPSEAAKAAASSSLPDRPAGSCRHLVIIVIIFIVIIFIVIIFIVVITIVIIFIVVITIIIIFIVTIIIIFIVTIVVITIVIIFILCCAGLCFWRATKHESKKGAADA